MTFVLRISGVADAAALATAGCATSAGNCASGKEILAPATLALSRCLTSELPMQSQALPQRTWAADGSMSLQDQVPPFVAAQHGR